MLKILKWSGNKILDGICWLVWWGCADYEDIKEIEVLSLDAPEDWE